MTTIADPRCRKPHKRHPFQQDSSNVAPSPQAKVIDISGYRQTRVDQGEACLADVVGSLFPPEVVENFGGSEEMLSCLESLLEKLHTCAGDEK